VQGPTGAIGVNFVGAYVPSATYAAGDAVSYQGSSYVSLVASNIGNTPDVSPAKWSLLAQAGIVGATGATGETGATGTTDGLFGNAGFSGYNLSSAFTDIQTVGTQSSLPAFVTVTVNLDASAMTNAGGLVIGTATCTIAGVGTTSLVPVIVDTTSGSVSSVTLLASLPGSDPTRYPVSCAVSGLTGASGSVTATVTGISAVSVANPSSGFVQWGNPPA
jgi:hypothetical protein